MNSNDGVSAAKTLDDILALLAEPRLKELIDDRVEAASDEFSVVEEPPLTHAAFNNLIARFVQHLHLHGLRLRRKLSPSGSLSEAVSLLEQGYEDGGGRGYAAALLIAGRSDGNQISGILSFLSAAITIKERSSYERWILAALVDPLNWDLKCRIVQEIMRRHPGELPENILRRPASCFADFYSQLIANQLETDRFLLQLSRPTPFSSGA
jgi:hypothetical protein